MGKKFLMILVLLGVALSAVTCGGESGNVSASDSEIQMTSDVELYKYFCDVTQDGLVAYIQQTNETIVCQYDDDFEDWAWVPKK